MSSEYDCPRCGTAVRARAHSQTTCPDCGYVVIEPEPDEPLRGYE